MKRFLAVFPLLAGLALAHSAGAADGMQSRAAAGPPIATDPRQPCTPTFCPVRPASAPKGAAFAAAVFAVGVFARRRGAGG
jgi:hypothetical protein